ncbi:MAG: hypothetical protein ACKO0M_14395 [Cyanobium sp.]
MNGPTYGAPSIEPRRVALILLVVVPVAANAIVSGWRRLARGFKAGSVIEGERFRSLTVLMGRSFSTSVTCRGVMLVTVGSSGLGVSLIDGSRFVGLLLLSPPLLLPWGETASMVVVEHHLLRLVVIRLRSSPIQLMIEAPSGRDVAAASARFLIGSQG